MKRRYQRWAGLYDKHRTGQELSAEELVELERLTLEVPASQHELLLREQLRELSCELTGTDESVVERALHAVNARDKVIPIRQRQLAGVSEECGAPPPAPERQPARWLRSVGIGALMSAAIVIVGFGLWPEAEPTRAPPPRAVFGGTSLPPVELTLTSGQVQLNGAETSVTALAIEPNATLAVGEGRACLAIDAQTDVCLDGGSRIVLDDQRGTRRSMKLMKGRVVVVLGKRPKNHSFSIIAGELSATALGTAFAVERDSAHEVSVTVIEGRVQVVYGQQERVVVENQRVRSHAGNLGSPRLTTRAEQLRHWSLVAARKLWKDASVGTLHVSAKPELAEVTLDGVSLGRAPLSLVAVSGQHELAVEHPEHERRSRQLKLAPGQNRRIQVLLEPAASAEATPQARPARSFESPPKEPTAPQSPSAQELLSRARALVKQGKWQGAVSAYRKLRRAYPDSSESHTVLVALGQLQLDRLGQPTQALTSFNGYLRFGGGLAQEARFGRLRALRSLGDIAGERQAIHEYLRYYPKGVDTRSLRRRLAQLDGQ